MEGSVTMSIKELDKLRLKITSLENKVSELELIKKPSHYFRVLYDFTKGTTAYNSWGYEIINEDNIDNRFEEIVKSNFEEILTRSKENKFYRKFPKWIHKLLNCDI
jgi:hypothetical protein